MGLAASGSWSRPLSRAFTESAASRASFQPWCVYRRPSASRVSSLARRRCEPAPRATCHGSMGGCRLESVRRWHGRPSAGEPACLRRRGARMPGAALGGPQAQSMVSEDKCAAGRTLRGDRFSSLRGWPVGGLPRACIRRRRNVRLGRASARRQMRSCHRRDEARPTGFPGRPTSRLHRAPGAGGVARRVGRALLRHAVPPKRLSQSFSAAFFASLSRCLDGWRRRWHMQAVAAIGRHGAPPEPASRRAQSSPASWAACAIMVRATGLGLVGYPCVCPVPERGRARWQSPSPAASMARRGRILSCATECPPSAMGRRRASARTAACLSVPCIGFPPVALVPRRRRSGGPVARDSPRPGEGRA